MINRHREQARSHIGLVLVVGSNPIRRAKPGQMPGFFLFGIRADKKRASKLFDGEEVEPSRLKMRMKQVMSLLGVQFTHHLRSGLSKQAAA
jgi:hypothetical protein